MAKKGSNESERREAKAQEDVWKEREKRLQELLEKEGENPEVAEDFTRLLGEMARQNSR